VPDVTAASPYQLVDATVGSRLVLGFVVPVDGLQARLPDGWRSAPHPPPTYAGAMAPVAAPGPPRGPNLVVVFNDLLLNQDAHGQTQADASARYVGFNIPAAHPATGRRGMVHVRIYTGTPQAVPGRYHDARSARVRHEVHLRGENTVTTVDEHWQLEPDDGGTIELRLVYDRGPLVRIVADQPDFRVWAAADARTLRIYQEDTLFETIHDAAIGSSAVKQLHVAIHVPELADLFNGAERLVAIFGNPHYARRVYTPRGRTP